MKNHSGRISSEYTSVIIRTILDTDQCLSLSCATAEMFITATVSEQPEVLTSCPFIAESQYHKDLYHELKVLWVENRKCNFEKYNLKYMTRLSKN
jgi:hypothetical protein